MLIGRPKHARRLVTVGAILALLVLPPASPAVARPGQSLPEPTDLVTIVVRQACAALWVDDPCRQYAYPDPGYATDAVDPATPYELRIGAVHEHSGYSDGDPTARPQDYFAAGRTGHNTADGGGDTGVAVDYVLGSEHSENEKLPVTTAEVCLDPTAVLAGLAGGALQGACLNVDQADHYRKWDATLDQARAETTDGFTALRGFEFTNDYYNHLGVYFSRNVVNAKVDGSYLPTEAFWNWLRRPAEQGGGDDALVVFNHPGGLPALTPFDGHTPINQLLDDTLGGANWHDLAYVPDVDDRVVGIEVNGNDDFDWYVKALRNGWHLGPVAAEDEHQRAWASSEEGKTLVLTRGTSPAAYYDAFQASRTIALAAEVIDGEPGTPARFPSVRFWADGSSVDDPAATVLGGTITSPGPHRLEVAAQDLTPGAVAVLVSSASDAPQAIGAADAEGTLRTSVEVASPTSGEQWWFVVVCQPDAASCGGAGTHSVVTAPIWIRATSTGAPAPAPAVVVAPAGSELPATGRALPVAAPADALAIGLALTRLCALSGAGRLTVRPQWPERRHRRRR